MYQDPIHAEHTHLVEDMKRKHARAIKLEAEVQAHRREHCLLGVPFNAALEEECF